MPIFFNTTKRTMVLVLLVLWGGMALVSASHLFSFSHTLQLSTSQAGVLAWVTFITTIIALGRHSRKELLGVFCLFFLFGLKVGPFLEPPSDPLDHLRNTYATCDETFADLKQTNKGIWQYSMLGNMLCHERYSVVPEDILQRIDIANGVFWATSASILFVVGIRAGLPAGWAFFSVCLAFLFMGTNRFSYFSYYSFAPSFSSIWVFWLWIAAFFFEKQRRYLLPGILAAGLGLFIISVNHIQETIFVSLVCSVWIFLFLFRFVAAYFSDDRTLRHHAGWWFFLGSLFTFFFVLPQWPVFQAGLSRFFLHDYWQVNQEAVFSWQGIHLMGKVWGYRIHDTLGLLGFLPVLLVPLFLFSKIIGNYRNNKWRILLLGLLPLFVYCIPLLNYIWLSNCIHTPTHIRYYYRMCYSSMFWLPVSLLLHNLGLHLQCRLPWHTVPAGRIMNGFFLTFCLICFVVLSRIQSAPVYGKLDFIAVNSKQWWYEWQPMIEKVVTWKKEKVETDYITGYVLHAVFNVPLKHNQFNLLSMDNIPKRSIKEMLRHSSVDSDTGCLINLHGVQATWVPYVTGHWSADLSQPAFLYLIDIREDDTSGNSGVSSLKGIAPEKCYVFF